MPVNSPTALVCTRSFGSDQMPGRMKPQGRRVRLTFVLRMQHSVAVRDVLALAAGVRGSWTHCIPNPEAERDESWRSVHPSSPNRV